MINRRIHTPEGVRDIYGDELQRRIKLTGKLHEIITSYGYRDIQTPSFEYLDIYSHDASTTSLRELYKFFDKEGDTLALRSDFTPAIARCASKYFLEDDMPTRLCYQGNTFSNRSELQGKLKETYEMGVELIDKDSTIDADAEMICLVVEALKAIGLDSFQIAIGEINYFKGLVGSTGLIGDDIEVLKTYIQDKNYFGARDFLERLKVDKNIIDALLEVSDINDIEALKAAGERAPVSEAKAACKRLEEIYNIICDMGYEKYVSFDLAMINQFHYYTGILLRVYTYGVGGSIAKGGRYDNLLSNFGESRSAVGLVFMIDELMSALKAQKLAPGVEYNDCYMIYDDNSRVKALRRASELRLSGTNAICVYAGSHEKAERAVAYAKEMNAKYENMI